MENTEQMSEMRDVNSIVVNGEAIGKVPGWYVYVPCVSCGKERWTLKTLTQRLKYTGLCHKCNLYAHSGENHPMWKGGRYIDNNGYVRVMIKGHPFGNKDGYVLEHRFVAVKEWSINAVKGMHVHHKNGDRTDNRIKNLELLSCREHTRLHKRTATSKQKLPEEPNPIISCKCGCGGEFPKYNKYNNPIRYIKGHNRRGICVSS